MTTAMLNHITRMIDKAEFDQTSDIARLITDARTLTRPERLVLIDKLAKRLQAIAGEARTP